MADYQKMLNAGKMDPYHARKWLRTDPKAKDLLAEYAKKQGKSSIYELFPGKRGEDVFDAPHGDGLNALQNIGNTTRQYIFDDAIDHATPMGPVSPGSQPSLEDLMRNSDIDLGPTPSEPIPKEEVTAQEIAEKDLIVKPDYRDPVKVKAEEEAATKKAEAEAAAPKTLEQPEGGAAQAPAQPAGPTGAGQRIKNINDAAQSLPANVPLGTGGATKANRAQMNMQAEANRQIGDLIKQQKKQSDQNNFLRDRYDATGGRRAGAFDRLSDQQKDEAVSNYRNRSFFDDSNPFHQQQYNDLMASGYTPPKADIQSQYEAASMNPPSVARADGTATTEEFGSMSPAQQNAFIQNYRYNPQGQAPETAQEGTMGSALEASNPMDNLDTVTVPGQYTAPKKVYPAPDSATEGDRGGIDVSEIFKQNPALQMDGEGNMLPPTDGPGDDVTKYTPPDVSNMPPIEDVFADLPEAPARPEAPYSPPDVSNMRPIEDVFNDLPQAPGRPQPQRAPAPAPIAKAPPPPPSPAPKQSMETPVYGKKKDGSYGVIGHRNREEMRKSMGGQRVKEWTASMERDRRDADFTNQARRGEIANPFGTDYNRALGQPNEDAYAKKRRSQPIYNPYSA